VDECNWLEVIVDKLSKELSSSSNEARRYIVGTHVTSISEWTMLAEPQP
jgi:hypothetical protein